MIHPAINELQPRRHPTPLEMRTEIMNALFDDMNANVALDGQQQIPTRVLGLVEAAISRACDKAGWL